MPLLALKNCDLSVVDYSLSGYPQKLQIKWKWKRTQKYYPHQPMTVLVFTVHSNAWMELYCTHIIVTLKQEEINSWLDSVLHQLLFTSNGIYSCLCHKPSIDDIKYRRLTFKTYVGLPWAIHILFRLCNPSQELIVFLTTTGIIT